MLTNMSQKLDDLIGQGKRCNDKRGLGFTGRKSKGNSNTMFVRECDTQNSQTENARGKYIVDAASPPKHISKTTKDRMAPEMNLKNCKVTLTSVNNPNSSDWYFESGCSRHMTGNSAFFLELSECNAESMVFSDGGKGRVINKGTIDHPGSPYLLDVRLVTRLSDNCYHWDLEVNLCNLSKAEEASLWHKRLGHISGTSIANVVKVNAIIAPLTPQLNEVVERKRRTLQEMARMMIHAKHLPIYFWVEALNTACHIHNQASLCPGTIATPYEL
ncbi:copia-like retroelement pol polyprotein [Cucumis melo var. makuwa]|uniref:Copia-like retroelement pol polyprotein n=1 Tax=Cucumis melo var. makuwa TaxID=1194695 RepID=A0A5D3CH13_CUCMM|nr:copia-like retroelement pol polyprotein [Cucumis melo var. makuwa]